MSQQRQMGQAQMATDPIWTCPNCKTEIVTKPAQGAFKVVFGCFFLFPFCYGRVKNDICPHCDYPIVKLKNERYQRPSWPKKPYNDLSKD